MKTLSFVLVGILVLYWALFFLGHLGAPINGTGVIDPRQIELSSKMEDALKGDPRNVGIDLKATYKGLGSPVLTLKVKRATGTSLDMFRVLWGFAEEMRHTRVEEVHFVNGHGDHIFTLSGTDFKEMGDQRILGENPLYVLLTFPEKLKTPTGSPAFGGALGVPSQQMADNKSAMLQWVRGVVPKEDLCKGWGLGPLTVDALGMGDADAHLDQVAIGKGLLGKEMLTFQEKQRALTEMLGCSR